MDPAGVILPTAAAAAFAGAAWAVRGRSSPVSGPVLWRGPRDRRVIALTFDDGPSEGSARILEILARFEARATFFQCGANAVRLPDLAKQVSAAGHEIGNHTQSHRAFWLTRPSTVANEIARAQSALSEIHGAPPHWFRPPYGVRWFGLAGALERHRLRLAMWTLIGRDWTLDGPSVAARLVAGAQPGAIVCLHDGRELRENPRIQATAEALEMALPALVDRGYRFCAVSDLL